MGMQEKERFSSIILISTRHIFVLTEPNTVHKPLKEREKKKGILTNINAPINIREKDDKKFC